MKLIISGKQMEVGEAFRIRIQEKIAASVAKHFGRPFSGRVAMEKEGGRFTADCLVSLDSGATMKSSGDAHDPHAAFDAAAERLDKQLRRYGRKLKEHQGAPQPAWG